LLKLFQTQNFTGHISKVSTISLKKKALKQQQQQQVKVKLSLCF